MSRAVAALFVITVVSSTLGAEALPRIRAYNVLRDIILKPTQQTNADELVVPEPTKYNNPKPLIGILSQACHYCPGK